MYVLYLFRKKHVHVFKGVFVGYTASVPASHTLAGALQQQSTQEIHLQKLATGTLAYNSSYEHKRCF